jgi:hypothetical protein
MSALDVRRDEAGVNGANEHNENANSNANNNNNNNIVINNDENGDELASSNASSVVPLDDAPDVVYDKLRLLIVS